ncbi:MAG: NAD-dependent epimerase/dehydratase family protein [Acidobacteriaceae bacterium]
MLKLITEKRILVTGAAGFIGAHLVHRLLADGFEVVGVDNLSDYYDPRLKNARLRKLCIGPRFWFFPLDLADKARAESLFASGEFDAVVHMAAQPGVRRSITNPDEYIASNLVAFINVLEGIRNCKCRHFVFASSSSVYGARDDSPFSEEDSTDSPVSLYAATKKSNEVVAHAYSHLFRIPTTGLRFFTVYGPWGRPDMAVFKFVDAILSGRVIELYNFGQLSRDLTFVDDVVEGIVRLLLLPPQVSLAVGSSTKAPMRICNIGNQCSVELLYLVRTLESCLDRQATIRLMPMQAGDVYQTQARVDRLQKLTGYTPGTSIEEGVQRFVDWYLRDYLPLGFTGSPEFSMPSLRHVDHDAASAVRIR